MVLLTLLTPWRVLEGKVVRAWGREWMTILDLTTLRAEMRDSKLQILNWRVM